MRITSECELLATVPNSLISSRIVSERLERWNSHRLSPWGLAMDSTDASLVSPGSGYVENTGTHMV